MKHSKYVMDIIAEKFQHFSNIYKDLSTNLKVRMLKTKES